MGGAQPNTGESESSEIKWVTGKPQTPAVNSLHKIMSAAGEHGSSNATEVVVVNYEYQTLGMYA